MSTVFCFAPYCESGFCSVWRPALANDTTNLPTTKSSDRSELIDINSASKEQLLTLPGIDESRAEKIIETRPYKNKKELKKKKIVSEEVYKQISDKITATPPNK